jgi:hypothetical protein
MQVIGQYEQWQGITSVLASGVKEDEEWKSNHLTVRCRGGRRRRRRGCRPRTRGTSPEVGPRRYIASSTLLMLGIYFSTCFLIVYLIRLQEFEDEVEDEGEVPSF